MYTTRHSPRGCNFQANLSNSPFIEAAIIATLLMPARVHDAVLSFHSLTMGYQLMNRDMAIGKDVSD